MKRVRINFTATENGFVDLEVDDWLEYDTDALWEMAIEKEINGDAYFMDRELQIERIERGV